MDAQEAVFGVDVEEEGEVRDESPGSEGVQATDLCGVDPPGKPLVGGGGVAEAVGQDGFSGREGGKDDRANVLGTRGLVEEQFGFREDALLARREQKHPDLVGHGRSARLAGDDVGNPFPGEVSRQEPGLRRLAGPLDSLECYERCAHTDAAVAPSGAAANTPRIRTSGT